MNKKVRVVGAIISIIAIVFLFDFKSVKAVETSRELESVQEVAGVLEPEKVEQKIVNVDANAVTIELKLKNKTEIKEDQENAEIFLLLDNSDSMAAQCENSVTRKKKVINSAIDLVNSIYKNTNTVKLGIIKFSSSASVTQVLTDDKDTVLNTLNNEGATAPSGSTNLAAGISLAKSSFSKDAKNKILVILTDGLPNDIRSAKSELDSLKSSDIYSISMLISGVGSSEDSVVEQVFGTESKSTTDKYYKINDNNIQKIINTDILTNVVDKLKSSINYQKVVEEFPNDIVNNFEFSAIENKNITIKNEYNTKKRIVWNINNKNVEDDVIIRYILILKNNYDTSIINKILPTTINTEISYNYVNTESKKVVRTQTVNENKNVNTTNAEEYKLNDSTKIILKEKIIENTNNEIKKDETIAKSTKLPQTGENGIIILEIVVASISMTTFGILLIKKRK